MNSWENKIGEEISSLSFPLGHIMITYKDGVSIHEYFVSKNELRKYLESNNVEKVDVLKENVDL